MTPKDIIRGTFLKLFWFCFVVIVASGCGMALAFLDAWMCK